MVAQPDDDPFPDHLRHGVLDRPAGLFVQDGEHRFQRLPLSLLLAPAGQGLGYRVEECHPTFGVRGDDAVADARQDRREAAVGRGLLLLGLAALQVGVGLPEGFLGPPPLRQVTGYLREASKVPRFIM